MKGVASSVPLVKGAGLSALRPLTDSSRSLCPKRRLMLMVLGWLVRRAVADWLLSIRQTARKRLTRGGLLVWLCRMVITLSGLGRV